MPDDLGYIERRVLSNCSQSDVGDCSKLNTCQRDAYIERENERALEFGLVDKPKFPWVVVIAGLIGCVIGIAIIIIGMSM